MGKLRTLRRSHITEEDRRTAVELIEEIRRKNGEYEALVQEAAETHPTLAKKFEEVLSSLEQKANSSMILLSNELYAEPGRYIYELIQNADDCEYSIVRSERKTPTLRFYLTDECLTVMSNEDGFSEANVRAICDMGSSSKTTGEHTGQKGIGFKSVFASAWKVDVRSDPYSFSFTPKETGNRRGLSLVLPTNEESRRLTSDEGSRLTLHLNSQTFKERTSEFHDLESSIMLFLKVLRRIKINIDTSHATKEILYVREDHETTRIIKKITTMKGIKRSEVSEYIIRSRHVRDLPVQQDGPQASSCRVELAFRIESNGKTSAMTRQHRAYACLPIENFDFKFDVNADFHVAANRQSLMMKSPRNERLRSEIAEAFCEQICSFSGSAQTSNSLRFSWPSYCSYQRAQASRFWLELQSVIDRKLQEMGLFWARSGVGQLRACEVFHVPHTYRDGHGNYLFDHLFCDDNSVQFLALEYPDEFWPTFERLGVEELSPQIFLEHIALDLELEERTYIRKYETAKEEDSKDLWHEKVTAELQKMLDSEHSVKLKRAVKALRFIPLTDGSWKSSAETIYFDPSSAGSSTPSDVRLNIVRSAALPKVWEQVFEKLGVLPLKRANIVSKIERIHDDIAMSRATITKDRVKDHLNYIFMNGAKDLTLKQNFHFLNHLGKTRRRQSDATRRFYYKSTVDEMSCFALLRFCNSSSVQFLHPELTSLFPGDQANDHGITWTQWLRVNGGVRSAPAIIIHPPNQQVQLSPEIEHIMEQSPDKIAQLLWHNWSEYREEFKELLTPEAHLLNDIQVQTASGLLCPISETYLPKEDMRKLCKDLGVKGPLLLDLEDLLYPISSSTGQTEFLNKRFGVKEKPDVNFYVKSLMELKESTDPSEIDQNQVRKIYALLEGKVRDSKDTSIKDGLQKDFEKHSLVFYCDSEPRTQQWLPLSECVWDKGDSLLTGRASIHSQYVNLSNLFSVYLNMDEPSLHMFVESLEDVLEHHDEDRMEIVKELLVKIASVIDDDELHGNESDLRSIQSDSEGDEGTSGSDSGCEGDETSKDGSTAPSVSDSDASDEDDDSITADHRTDENVNDFQHNEALAKLKQGSFEFLPIRDPDGQRRLASCEETFVVPDLYDLRNDFENDIPMLDLTLPQIHTCSNLIKRLGLGARLISNLGEYKLYPVDAHFNKKLTEIFRGKASSFCGCLKKFMKIDDERLWILYDRLRRVEILTCGEMLKIFRMEFESRRHEAKPRTAYCHIKPKERHEGSDFYFDQILVLKDPIQRQRGDLTDFPQTIIKLLRVQDPEAKAVITWIVGASSDGLAQELMEAHNIPLWPIQEFHDESDEVDDLSEGKQDSVTDLNTINKTIPVRMRSSEVDSLDDRYAKILKHVAIQAQTIELPRNGCSALSDGDSGHVFERFQDIFHKDNWVKEERNFKVGAAGELFVYEVIRRITNDCMIHNWTSRVRHHVSILESFEHIGKWEADHEVTDLQYEDKSGKLTRLLLSLEYLQPESVSHQPKYLIEVKTGVGKCESEFHVSDTQYRLMERNTMKKDQESEQIYMLWRVFDVDRDRIGLRIFIDPWAARNQSLQFTESKQWSVKVMRS